MHISLAHFEPVSTDAEPQSKEDTSNKSEGSISHEQTQVSESILEGKILNQIIHQIDEGKIPQTNFRKKNTHTTQENICRTILLSVLGICAAHLFFSWDWIAFVDTFCHGWLKNILLITTRPTSFLISGVVLTGIITYHAFQMFKSRKYASVLRKLSIQGNEIELFEDENNSFFDKYLNEVLYLFENVDVDAIVFEDMDRYEMEEIFERLHEVNTLANIRLKNSKKGIIRFFFLLRDDLFVSKDRTKFFDYIIPVVPVVDGSNSYDQFVAHLKKNNLHEIIDNHFLQGMSLYIDDMRLLKNVCNEFLIYYYRLNGTEIDPNKLLAIIAYKNLFPKDFSELQVNKGFVYAIFSHKEGFISSEVNVREKKIKEIEDKIKIRQTESANSLRELGTIFLSQHLTYYTDRLSGWTDDQLFDFLKKHLPANVFDEYSQRREVLEERLLGDEKKLEKEICDIQLDITSLRQKKMCEIINRDNINEVFNISSGNAAGDEFLYMDVKRNEYFNLLKYLIRNGYIDESYSDYMTYFYPNSLTTADKVFLQSIANKVSKPYEYVIRNPDLVVAKMSEFDCDEEETKNFSLLTYLLLTPKHDSFLTHLLLQLQKSKDYDFVSQYLTSSDGLPEKFTEKANIHWASLFYEMLHADIFAKKTIRDFCINTLRLSDDATVLKVNQNDCLTEYISNQRDFLIVDTSIASQIAKRLDFLKVQFVDIEVSGCNRELFNHVYNHSLYTISFENIKLMLEQKYSVDDISSVRVSSLTLIFSDRKTPLAKHISKNWSAFIDCMLAYCGGIIQDDEGIAAEVINSEDLSNDQKTLYINYLQTVIGDLSAIKDTRYWLVLIKVGLIKYSDDNLVTYWNTIKKIDRPIIEYINQSDSQFDLSDVIQDTDERKALAEAILQTVEIDNSKYINLINTLDYICDDFDVTGIPYDKMELLIENKAIRMNTLSLRFIRTNYPENVNSFIRENLEEYSKIMDRRLFSHEELLEILSWGASDDIVLDILGYANNSIPISGKAYSVPIKLFILNNLLDASDVPELYSSYSEQPEEIQDFIHSYAETHWRNIVREQILLENVLLDKLMCSANLTSSQKAEILATMVPRIEKELIYQCLLEIGLIELAKIFERRSQPRIPKTQDNQILLDVFVREKIIHDYGDHPRDCNYYGVHRKEPRKNPTPV